MENTQEVFQASRQSNLSSESLNLEDLQDQNQLSISTDHKQNASLNISKKENQPRNLEEPKSQKSFANLQRELSKYKKLNDEIQFQLLKEQSKSREISNKLDAALSLNQKYEKELQSIKEQNNEKAQDSSPSQNTEDITNTFSLFENLMKSQADDISQLSEQRNEMFKICLSYQKCLEVADKQIQYLQNQIQYQNQDNFSDLLKEVLQIYKTNNQEEEKEEADQSPHDQILSIVQKLCDKSSPQEDSEEAGNQPSTNAQILGHLENALYFIRTLKDSKPDEKSSLKDKELRKIIGDQCKQIEDFLKENKPEAVTSLFNNSNIDDQLNTFYDFVDHKKKNESPFRELYSLFTATIEVNQMLFERNNELTDNNQKSKVQAELLQKELKESNSNCDKNQEIMQTLLDQMEKTLDQRPKDVLTGYRDVCFIINELMKELGNHKKETESLKRKYNKIKKSNDSKSDQLRSKDQQISEMTKEYTEAQSKADSRKAELEAQLQKLQNHQNEKSDKIDRQSQKLQKLKEQNKELQAQLDEHKRHNEDLHARIANYMTNEDINASTITGFENQLSKMKTKNAELKKQNNELEAKLHNIIEEIKTQNDSLEKSYKDNLQQLSSENEELRNKLEEEKEVNKQNQQRQNEYQTKAAKMKLNDLQRATELNETKKALEKSEQQSIAKLDAQKIAYEELIHKYEQNCDDCAQRIAILLDEDINQIEIEDNSDDTKKNDHNLIHEKKLNLNLIIDLIEEKIHPNLVRDAKETKAFLKLDKNESIYSTVKRLVKGMMQKDKSIKNLEKNNGELKRKTEAFSAEELNNWKDWGNRQYRKINGDELKPFDPEKTRESIENVLNIVANPQSIERKIDILKSEKQILSKFENDSIQKSSTEPIESIRTLTLAFMLIERLQKFSQNVQLPYKLIIKNNTEETENGEEEEEEGKNNE